MINTLVNLDIGGDSIARSRSVRVGDIFPIVLYVEHDGQSDDDVLFDTLILEVFFNEGGEHIVRVDPTDRPVVGEIAARHGNTHDAFRRGVLSAPHRLSLDTAESATPLTLFGAASSEPAGPYLGRTGRAGIHSTGEPFRLRRGDPPVSVAMGKARAGLLASQRGQTRLIANGIAFLKGETVPITSTPSVLTIG